MKRHKRRFFTFVRKYGTILVLMLLFFVLAIFSPTFRTLANLADIIDYISILSLIAAGTTMVMLTGELDLSVGSLTGLAGVVTAVVLRGGHNYLLAICAGLVIGVLLGTFNGILVGTVRIPAFIATISTMFIIQGIEFQFTQGHKVLFQSVAPSFRYISHTRIGLISIPVIIMAGIYFILYIFLHHSKFGYSLYTIGGNPRAANSLGINVKYYKWITYLFSGVLCAVAGILLISRLELAPHQVGLAYVLDSLAAAFLGMTTIRKGEIHIVGTLIGVLLIGLLENGLTIFYVPYEYQFLVRGLVLIGVVSASSLSAKYR